MLFPMYTVSSKVLLRMTTVQPHEELKAEGFCRTEALSQLRGFRAFRA